MMLLLMIFLSTCLASASTNSTVSTDDDDFIRVCYYTSWSRYRPSAYAKFDIDNIDPALCTHLVYAFARIDVKTLTLTAAEPWFEEPRENFVGRFQRFNELKKINPKLKTLLSVGGETAKAYAFNMITKDDVSSQSFAKNVVGFLQSRGFDGIDIDWEFPTNETRDTFVNLLQALRESFDLESPPLLLSVAVSAGKWTIDEAYDVPNIARYVDIVNIMSYDFTVIGSKLAAFNSPLYSRKDPGFNEALSVDYAVRYWHQLGLPFNKMAVGMTGVGRHFLLKNPEQTDVGAPVEDYSKEGTIYSFSGSLAYPEICLLQSDNETTVYWDDEQAVPYLVNEHSWVGYENVRSAKLKGRYMRDLGVAGMMFWELGLDDFSGQACNEGRYPLIRATLDGAGVVIPALTTQAPSQAIPTSKTPRSNTNTKTSKTRKPTTKSSKTSSSETRATIYKDIILIKANRASAIHESNMLLFIFIVWILNRCVSAAALKA